MIKYKGLQNARKIHLQKYYICIVLQLISLQLYLMVFKYL